MDGWNKPLTIRWKFYLPELISCIKQQIDRLFKNPTGALKASFSLANIHTIKQGGKEGVTITNSLPYAEIQNYGGFIPDRIPIRAKALHWVDASGNSVFAKRAKGFEIIGKQYIEKAVEQWGMKNIDIEWDE